MDDDEPPQLDDLPPLVTEQEIIRDELEPFIERLVVHRKAVEIHNGAVFVSIDDAVLKTIIRIDVNPTHHEYTVNVEHVKIGRAHV